MTILTDLFDRYGSDKGTQIDGHLYSLDYERLIPRDATALCEVGIGTHLMFNGRCGSIRAWLEWLPQTMIYGIDVWPAPADLLAQPRFKFFQGDQSDHADLERIAAQLPLCDVIIDDGDHFGPHQLLTFDILWNRVKPGGIYVVEDIYLRWNSFSWMTGMTKLWQEEHGTTDLPPYAGDVLSRHPCFEGYIGREQHGIYLRKPIP